MNPQGITKPLMINGRIRDIDVDIFDIVKALNDCGMTTIACCSGHGKRPPIISLADGREILILPDYETARRVDNKFPPLHPRLLER